MTELEAFLLSVRKDKGDASRLMYADWLEENGYEEQAVIARRGNYLTFQEFQQRKDLQFFIHFFVTRYQCVGRLTGTDQNFFIMGFLPCAYHKCRKRCYYTINRYEVFIYGNRSMFLTSGDNLNLFCQEHSPPRTSVGCSG